MGVTAEGGKLLIPVGKSSVQIFRYANPLYFYVEKETQEFDLELTGQGEVHLAARKYKNTLYIIATNPTETAAELSVDLRPEGAGAKAREVFEKRDIQLTGGHLQDYFNSLDTRVYRIPI